MLADFRSVVPSTSRDVIVIGCSAGGVEALPRLLQQLPAGLPAAVLIVQHMAPDANTQLAGILDRSCQLPVAWADQGAPIKHGCVLVGPPDVHLLIAEGRVHLSGGARENHSRPSIDKLFRSAAAAYGSRVIGVLLTGMLHDGVAGLSAIRLAGGASIVQDPQDAAFPDLPSHALEIMVPDRTLPVDAIGGALADMVGRPVEAMSAPSDILLEAEIDRDGAVAPERMSALGPQTPLVCPDCNGPMWRVGAPEARRFRCYLGHASGAQELLDASDVEVESALWSAVRALNDRAITLETLAADSRRIGHGQSAEHYEARAREARRQAVLARQFMLDLARGK